MHESTLKVVGHFACWSHCGRGPKTCFYKKTDVPNPDELEVILVSAFGKKGEVRIIQELSLA